MNVKINKYLHNKLCELDYSEYIFGSHLHGVASENSDKDYIRVISNEFYDRFKTEAIYLPNIHSFQYDDVENNTQIVWMTIKQFYNGLFSGDGNMIADIVLLSDDFENAMFLCRTYKIIKGYLGVAKRDLKIHKDNKKKRFHAYRSLYMAECLMNNKLPIVTEIKGLKQLELPNKDVLRAMEMNLRNTLNAMLNNGEINHYPTFSENDELVKIMVSCNNIKEFKYE